MADQQQEVQLEKLLNLALGHPGQGVVDFRLLKEFLMQVLVATKTKDFAVAKEFAGNGVEVVELRPKKDGEEIGNKEGVGTVLLLNSQNNGQEDYKNIGILTEHVNRLSFVVDICKLLGKNARKQGKGVQVSNITGVGK